MRYNNTEVTLYNYKKIFRDKDIQDIVRACIEDNIAIGEYITPCLRDPFRLWQIKYYLQEGLPKEYIRKIPYGSVLYKIRLALQAGYAPPINIHTATSEKVMLRLIDWHTLGYEISDMDFSMITERNIDGYERGLRSGLDITPFLRRSYSTEYLLSLYTILDNGKDCDIFLKGDWSLEVIKGLSELSYDSGIYDKLVPYLKSDIKPEYLYEVIRACNHGFDPEDLLRKNRAGNYKRDIQFLQAMNYSLDRGVTIDEISDIYKEMQTIKVYGYEKAQKRRTISRRLTK